MMGVDRGAPSGATGGEMQWHWVSGRWSRREQGQGMQNGQDGNAHHSQRKLGFWMCTALVVGNTIGIGIFLLPA
jgi:hypothetical protein